MTGYCYIYTFRWMISLGCTSFIVQSRKAWNMLQTYSSRFIFIYCKLILCLFPFFFPIIVTWHLVSFELKMCIQHISAEGYALIKQADDADNNQLLIELHNKYMVYVTECFENHSLFHKVWACSLVSFVSHNIIYWMIIIVFNMYCRHWKKPLKSCLTIQWHQFPMTCNNLL